MPNHIWIVSEFVDNVDSVWDTQDGAIERAAELDRGNGCGDFSCIHEFFLNTPEGYVC